MVDNIDLEEIDEFVKKVEEVSISSFLFFLYYNLKCIFFYLVQFFPEQNERTENFHYLLI